MAMESLLRNKKKITDRESKLKEERSQYEKQMHDLEENLKEFYSLKDTIPSLRRYVERASSDIIRITRKKNDLMLEKEAIIAKIRRRAELRGIPQDQIPQKLSNARTERIDKEILSTNIQLEEKHDYINSNKYKISKATDYYFERNKKNEMSSIQNKIKSIDKKLYEVWKNNKEVDGLILEEKMRSQYEEYADEHDIEYDTGDDEDIFWKCNLHHHLQLLDGHETYTKCHKNYRDCSEDVTLSVDSWGNIEGTCECGIGYWEKEDPPRDLTDFNINSTHVYGYMNWSGY